MSKETKYKVCKVGGVGDCIVDLTDNTIVDTIENLVECYLLEIKTAPKLYAVIEALINRGVELISIDEIEDEEDAEAVHSDFNDTVILAKKLLAEARGE